MCHLAFAPAGNDIPTEHILNAASHNMDGHGWAIVADRRIVIGKSMDVTEALETFEAARRVHRGPALFHSRWATAGTLDEYNVHPFYVGQDALTVVAHNGVLPSDAQPSKLDRRSDTHVFAMDMASNKWGSMRNAQNRKSVERWMGKHNKLVVLTANPAYARQSFILNEDSGHWVDGIWHSNSDYQYAYKAASNPRWSWLWDDEYPSLSAGAKTTQADYDELWSFAPCWACESTDVDDDLAVCRSCNMCLDCESYVGGKDPCLCYGTAITMEELTRIYG